MEFIGNRGYSQTDQPSRSGLVKLLWQILQIGIASHTSPTSRCPDTLGNAEIQEAERSLAQGNSLVGSHCTPRSEIIYVLGIWLPTIGWTVGAE